MNNQNKITKSSIPKDFTLPFAIIDAVSVALLSISIILIACTFKSILFALGASPCVFAGLCKVIWKFIAATKQKLCYTIGIIIFALLVKWI